MKLFDIKILFSSCSGWNNHLPLLWQAIMETKKGDIIEMGIGGGSTLQLHYLCGHLKRKLISYETKKDFYNEFLPLENKLHKIILLKDDEKEWDKVHIENPKASVYLIDHGHGDRRHIDLQKLSNLDGIIVCHDTQPPPTAADYKWNWNDYKYKVDIQVPKSENGDNGTWSSAVSNFYDIIKWSGLIFGKYTISNGR